MIISELHGGLGNQMFEYATAKSVAVKNNTDLKLDLVRFMHKSLPVAPKSVTGELLPVLKNTKDNLRESILNPIFKVGSHLKKDFYSLYSINHYKTDSKRVYELYNFNIESTPLSAKNIFDFHLNNKLFRNYKFITEHTEFVLNSEIFDQGKNAYLMGFWQSEKYFKNIEDQIRKEFTVKVEPSEDDKKMIELINSTNSVSLHVRRGDYAASAVHGATHGVLSMEYYNNAIEYIKSKVENPHFFIFSDDPDWAKDNIQTGCPVSVSYNPAEVPYADIRLMYNCKHNIIANSTYSWWGAWLGTYKNKITVAPKHWVADSSRNTQDAVPESWIRI